MSATQSLSLPLLRVLASILLALAAGALIWFISGVDFRASNPRFARLT